LDQNFWWALLLGSNTIFRFFSMDALAHQIMLRFTCKSWAAQDYNHGSGEAENHEKVDCINKI
jgi:hypothetical protein